MSFGLNIYPVCSHYSKHNKFTLPGPNHIKFKERLNYFQRESAMGASITLSQFSINVLLWNNGYLNKTFYKMIRKISSVIASYAIFALSSVLLFNLTGHHPHQDAPAAFKIATVIYGVFFSALAGFVLPLMAGEKKPALNFILALVIFLLAAISLITSKGSHWTQLFAMLIFAPASILGGYLKNRSTRRR